MKRKFLEGLGLDKETIDKIMDENGTDIEAAKTTVEEKVTLAETDRDNYKKQLHDTQESLKALESVDVEGQKKTIEDLTAKLKQQEDEWQKKETARAAEEADKEFNEYLESIAKEKKAIDTKSVLVHLDRDALKSSKNRDKDVEVAFDSILESKAHLFESGEPFQNPVLPTQTNSSDKPMSLKDSIAKRLDAK